MMSARSRNPIQTAGYLATLLGGSLSFGSPAFAEDAPDWQIFEHAVELSDAELAEMRGRFVSPEGVMFFGVEMQSQWITRKGDVLEARMDFTVDFSKNQSNSPGIQIRPTINIVQTGSPGQPSAFKNPSQQEAVAPTTIQGSGVLDRTTGVGQLIQVTGDKNRIINDLQMSVVGARDRPSDPPAASHGVNLPGTLSVASDSGATAAVMVENNALGVSLAIPGEGEIKQAIRAGDFGSGVLQQAQVMTDFNQIHNTISITMGSNALRDASSVNAAAALSSLRDLQK